MCEDDCVWDLITMPRERNSNILINSSLRMGWGAGINIKTFRRESFINNVPCSLCCNHAIGSTETDASATAAKWPSHSSWKRLKVHTVKFTHTQLKIPENLPVFIPVFSLFVCCFLPFSLAHGLWWSWTQLSSNDGINPGQIITSSQHWHTSARKQFC